MYIEVHNWSSLWKYVNDTSDGSFLIYYASMMRASELWRLGGFEDWRERCSKKLGRVVRLENEEGNKYEAT